MHARGKKQNKQPPPKKKNTLGLMLPVYILTMIASLPPSVVDVQLHFIQVRKKKSFWHRTRPSLGGGGPLSYLRRTDLTVRFLFMLNFSSAVFIDLPHTIYLFLTLFTLQTVAWNNGFRAANGAIMKWHSIYWKCRNHCQGYKWQRTKHIVDNIWRKMIAACIVASQTSTLISTTAKMNFYSHSVADWQELI